MAQRSLGWVQNPSDLNKLKDVVSIFVKGSEINQKLADKLIKELVEDEVLKKEMIEALTQEEIVIKYNLLKGKGAGGKLRKDAKCTGIVQAAIPSQSGRKYTDDWTADGFLRWAISIGFLDYNKKTDTCKISDLGKRYALSKKDSKEEEDILIQAFLSYPPAVRILRLLKEQGHLTKFELGKQLGGLGEAGFTSIPQDLYVQALETAPSNKRTKIRSNTEGSADKYARMISGWLTKVGLVQRVSKKVTINIGKIEYTANIGHAYRITLKGIKELKRATGTSSVPRIPKIVYWEMLATKVKDRDYIRTRRAHIIECLVNKEKDIKEIKEYLKSKDMVESEITIQDEIKVIEAIGLNLQKSRNKYSIKDTIIHLDIPREKSEKTYILELKDRLREELKYIDHRYLGLIDLAYDGNASRDFEIQTIDLLTNELDFKGMRLGESRKPDGIIFYRKDGVIIDNKAYASGYELPISQADEMIRYIEENTARDPVLNPNEWWESFDPEVKNFYFLFITSYLKNRFKNNLEYISNRTSINGGAINVENLLYFAEKVKSGEIMYEDTFGYYKNDEIILKN